MTEPGWSGGRAAPVAGAPLPTAGPPARFGRRLRVPVFSAVTVTLGVGAHLAAGGAGPSTGQLLLIVTAVALTCSVLTGRELRLPALLGAVGLTEAGIHVALLGGGHAAHAVDRSGSARMLLAHLTASLLLAWWLRRGEAAVWRAVDRAGGLLAAVAADPLPLPGIGRPTTDPRPAPLRSLHVRPVHPVRGPPCVA